MPIPTIGYAAQDTTGIMKPWKFDQRDLGPNDVHIRVVACGICQTDVHQANNSWGMTIYPVVPGHEVTGIVEAVGDFVTKVRPGEKAGILVDCCKKCDECHNNKEQYCAKMTLTNGRLLNDGSPTFGGYARDIVIEDKFVCRFPENLDLYTGAPLLCAGISVYSAIRKNGMDKPGKRLGVIGLGGLGHMAVKFGVAFGLEVTVISHSESKKEEALGVLGVQKFLNSTDANVFDDTKNSLDFILDTVGGPDVNTYLSLLAVDGVMVLLGVPGAMLQVNGLALIYSRRSLTGGLIGSINETEEMLKFCAENNITAMIEKVPMDYVHTAWERMLSSDVHYRFVIDVQGSCPSI